MSPEMNMGIVYENNLDTDKFARMFNNKAQSYKFCCGFSQLSALEFLRSGTETCETKNHLLRGWCSKCL